MVGGEIDQKGEQMFALRRNAPGCVTKGAGAATPPGVSKKKKKYFPFYYTIDRWHLSIDF